MTETIYCIDTCSLIKLSQDYRIETFPSLWKELANLVNFGRLIAPIEVSKEIKWDEKLMRWVKAHKRMFKNLDSEQVKIVKDILDQFPSLIDSSKETPDADPFLIALAMKCRISQRGELFPVRYIVVTEENPSGSKDKLKIPDVCNHYGIECIHLADLFTKEQWKF